MKRSINDISIGQVVQHYKGGLYRVSGFVQLEASNVPAVAYEPLDRTKPKVTWARAADDFLGQAGDIARFNLLPTPSDQALYQAIPSFLMDADAVESVLKHYDAPHRYYHCRGHVLAMFQRAANENIVLAPEQALAILFHDVVYVPAAPQGFNENASAQMVDLYRERIKLSSVNLEVVKQIIRDSATHVPTNPMSPVVLDLDLVELAGTFSEFMAAWELNRLECAHLVASSEDPVMEFDKARLRFFLQMCRESKIFHSTKFAADSYEDAFRQNVEAARQRWISQHG